jgi:diguanylate cyclase (GGDEF)-like protein
MSTQMSDRSQPEVRDRLPTRLYVAGVCALGLAIVVAALSASAPAQPATLAALLAISLAASLAKIEIAIFGSAATLTACHIIDLLALLTCGADAAVLVASWGAWTQCTFRNREPNPLHQTLFSVAALAISMAAAGAIYGSLGEPSTTWSLLQLKSFAAAATTFFMLNTGLVAGAVALSARNSFARIWFDFFLSVCPSYLIGAAIAAVLAAGIQDRDYWLVPLLVGALAVLHRNYQTCLARMNDAVTDPLTSLPNKRFAVDFVTRELARVQRTRGRLSVALLDLDGFKRINDVDGHSAGDRALRTVGDCLTRALRASDLCARYGGDEFLLVMPDCGAADALRRVEEMQAEVASAARDGQFGGDLSVSAGIAVFPDDGVQFDALFANADARMYRSKFARVTRVSRERYRQAPIVADEPYRMGVG